MTKNSGSLPTVRFDSSRVTEAVKADLWTTIQEFEDLPYGEEKTVYKAAVRSLVAGHNLSILCDAMIQLGVSKNRAAQVSRYLNARSHTLMQIDQCLSLGYVQAIWLSGGVCYDGQPTEDDLRRHQAHALANGKQYLLKKGLLVGHRHTHPGLEFGCKCVFGPAIKGVDY